MRRIIVHQLDMRIIYREFQGRTPNSEVQEFGVRPWNSFEDGRLINGIHNEETSFTANVPARRRCDDGAAFSGIDGSRSDSARADGSKIQNAIRSDLFSARRDDVQ